MPRFPYNTVWDRWKEASVPNTSSICAVVSMQYRLVTDGRTDRLTHDDSKYRASIASRGKNCVTFLCAHFGCTVDDNASLLILYDCPSENRHKQILLIIKHDAHQHIQNDKKHRTLNNKKM